MATKFATQRHPWTGAVLPQNMTIKKTIFEPVDVNALVIANDPLPVGRISPNKYRAIFERLKVGQCIRCKPSDVARIGNALRKHVEVCNIKTTKGGPVRLISQREGADGVGRVWIVAQETART